MHITTIQPLARCPGCGQPSNPEALHLVVLNRPFVNWRCSGCRAAIERMRGIYDNHRAKNNGAQQH